jgi:hypothetical protein
MEAIEPDGEVNAESIPVAMFGEIVRREAAAEERGPRVLQKG